MQKVVGSNPIIRSMKALETGPFLQLEEERIFGKPILAPAADAARISLMKRRYATAVAGMSGASAAWSVCSSVAMTRALSESHCSICAASSVGGCKARTSLVSARTRGITRRSGVATSPGIGTSVCGAMRSSFGPYTPQIFATRAKHSDFVGAAPELPLKAEHDRRGDAARGDRRSEPHCDLSPALHQLHSLTPRVCERGSRVISRRLPSGRSTARGRAPRLRPSPGRWDAGRRRSGEPRSGSAARF
jgi:hypothetical protein